MEGEEFNTEASIITFTDALRAKYEQANDDEELENIQIPQRRREAYAKLQSCLWSQFLSLDGCYISHAGMPGEIQTLCPNVVELDLSGNQFRSWTEVLTIMSQLSSLSFLNLSLNPIDSDISMEEIEKIFKNNVIPNIQKLVLNDTCNSIMVVFKLLKLLKSIEELHISLNSFDEFPLPDFQYSSLRRLLFACNGIKASKCLENIGTTFPSLVSLIFCENPLDEVDGDILPGAFQNLRTLSLSNSLINSWDSIDALSKFPALDDLRIVGIPLLDSYTKDEGRQLVISRVPNVKKLNSSQVSESERENAERFFIRHYMDQEIRPRRYDELVAVHGVLHRLADVSLGLSRYEASVTIHFGESAPKLMKVDVRQKVSELRKQLAKSVGLRSNEIRLLYRNVEVFEHLDEMSFATRSLINYRISDGDEIHIIEKWIKK